MDNETLHWDEVTGKQKEKVLGFHIFVEQKRERNTNGKTAKIPHLRKMAFILAQRVFGTFIFTR